jgi:hypothetical protein
MLMLSEAPLGDSDSDIEHRALGYAERSEHVTDARPDLGERRSRRRKTHPLAPEWSGLGVAAIKAGQRRRNVQRRCDGRRRSNESGELENPADVPVGAGQDELPGTRHEFSIEPDKQTERGAVRVGHARQVEHDIHTAPLERRHDSFFDPGNAL